MKDSADPQLQAELVKPRAVGVRRLMAAIAASACGFALALVLERWPFGEFAALFVVSAVVSMWINMWVRNVIAATAVAAPIASAGYLSADIVRRNFEVNIGWVPPLFVWGTLIAVPAALVVSLLFLAVRAFRRSQIVAQSRTPATASE